MPAEVIDEPLSIACIFPSGTSTTRFVGAKDCPQLAGDLVAGLAGLVHPHGRIGSRSSIGRAMIAIRRLAAMLGAQGFRGGASQLSRVQLVEFFMGASHADERAIRAMLHSWDMATGELNCRVVCLVEDRPLNAKRGAVPL